MSPIMNEYGKQTGKNRCKSPHKKPRALWMTPNGLPYTTADPFTIQL